MGNSVVESRQAVVQRYVDILTDAGLKAVFGDQRNKDVLIDILNVILPHPPASQEGGGHHLRDYGDSRVHSVQQERQVRPAVPR